MPWYCAYCSRWSPQGQQYCTSCGRSGTGRLCRKCKAKVSGSARYCGDCGSDKFIEAAIVRHRLPVPVRIASLGAICLTGWLLIPPLLHLLWEVLVWLYHLAIVVATFGFVFWVLTGILPSPLREWVRKAAWALLKGTARIVRGVWC